MSAAADDALLQPLAPRASGRTAREVVANLGLRDAAAGKGPVVVAAMIMSADGRAQVTDRSVGLGNPADRDLLRELRTGADAILVGSRTLAAERYATLLDPGQRAHREAQGLAPHPLIVTVSRDLDLRADDIPILAEEDVPVVVYTESRGRLTGGIDVEVRRLDALTLGAVLDDIAARRGVRGVACEGGPALLRALVAERRLDALLLTLAPKLVAGEAITLLEGDILGDSGVDLELRDVHRAGDHVFLRYVPRPS